MQPALTVPITENTDENKLVRRRKRFPLSFILGGIAILAAVIYLISANTQANAVYYMTVNELRSCTTCTAQSVRVAGTVQAGSVVRSWTFPGSNAACQVPIQISIRYPYAVKRNCRAFF